VPSRGVAQGVAHHGIGKYFGVAANGLGPGRLGMLTFPLLDGLAQQHVRG